MRIIGIYKITNKINNKCYIGQSVNIARRWKEHRQYAFRKNRHDYNHPLYRAIMKYGVKNFTFEVLEECEVSDLNEREIYYIALYRAHGESGYNQDDGGNASHPSKLTIENVKAIIDRLRNTKDTYTKIGDDFGVHNKMIWAINVGQNWNFDNEDYPIRKKAGSN